MNRCLLSQLEIGESAEVLEVTLSSFMRRRLLDIGVTRGAIIKKIMKSRGGDPSAYLIRGTVMAIRKKDAEGILVLRGENNGVK